MLLALLLAQLAPANPAGPIVTNPAMMRRLAFFEAFPSNGAGTSGACSTTPPTAFYFGAPVAIQGTRSTVAWCTNDDYSLTQLGVNQPRVMRGRPGAPLGLYSEPDATNALLHNRDGSQAAWTKTNVTCTKTATGVDGVANSATRCTATAANGTVLQALVRASSDNATSVYVRRNGGSSVVEVTRDNGTTWNAITSGLTSNWKRAVCRDTEGCMGGRCLVVPDLCATSANPTVGFRIVGSGDSIDFDLAQNEPTLDTTSPITTAGTATPRGYDYFYADFPRAMTALGSMRATVVDGYAPGGRYYATVSLGGGAPFSTLATAAPASAWLINAGCTNTVAGAAASGINLASGGPSSYSCSWNTTTRRGVSNGIASDAPAAVTLLTGSTRIWLGGVWLGGASQAGAVVSQVCVGESYRQCDATPASPPSTSIVWLGDSIVNGSTTSTPTYPTAELYRLYGQYVSKSVQTVAVPGFGITEVAGLWANAKASGFASALVLVGVNNLRASASAALIWSSYEPMLNEMLAMGMRVVPVHVTPWANWSEWTPAKQVQTDLLNGYLTSWCTANSMPCVDTSSLGEPVTDGGTGRALKAAYDFGDGLHLNGAGATALATLAAGAAP